jgi:hypothetical protein
VSSDSGVAARAFDGGPLERQKVRFVYLDEGGISKREPWVVVAGVILHGDTQVVPLGDHLGMLVKSISHPSCRKDLCFMPLIFGQGLARFSKIGTGGRWQFV